MAKQAEITLANFDKKLGATIRAIRNQTETNLQAYLTFAGTHYLTQGDSGLLTKCIQACVGVPALKTQTMEAYIEASSDLKVRSVEIKKGNNAGKKQKVLRRAEKGAEVPRVYLPFEVDGKAINWTAFEQDKAVATLKPIDEDITNFIKREVKTLAKRKGKDKADTLKRLVTLSAMIGYELVINADKKVKKAA